MPARTGKGRQKKGRAFEREIIQRLWRLVGESPPWKPHARPDDGYQPPPELGAYHFEMKNQDRPSILTWFRQGESDAGGKRPVLIFKTGKQIYVLMKIQDWERFARELYPGEIEDEAT